MPNIKFNHTAGYTIIETMIAISIFLVVVTIGTGSLLNANLIHHKSSDMRSIMDNMSFVLEDMSRSLRVGTSYRCFFTESIPTSASLVPQDCVDGNTIAFLLEGEQLAYHLTTDGKIIKFINGFADVYQLTPDEVVINQISGFTVTGAPNLTAGDTRQPFVNIRLVGEIISKEVASPFSIQTSVSQRLVDIQ